MTAQSSQPSPRATSSQVVCIGPAQCLSLFQTVLWHCLYQKVKVVQYGTWYEHWSRSWQSQRQSANKWWKFNSGGRLPGLQLSSQLQSITAVWIVPNYTACVTEAHVCEQFAHSRYMEEEQPRVKPATSRLQVPSPCHILIQAYYG